MRDLHVVALSEDGQHVVLATRPDADRGEFRVAVDDRLTASLRGELPRPGEAAPRHVTPREIQARLRDGESVEQIAVSAGLPVAKIERFAGPVLSELERVVDGARAAVLTRPRRGRSALPLGESVDQHLAAAAGHSPGSTRWTARREEPGRWVVEVTWTARGRQRRAGWSYDATAREIQPRDAPSAALGHTDPEEAAGADPSRRLPRRQAAAEAPTTRPSARTAKAPATRSRTAPAAPAAPRTAEAAPAPGHARTENAPARTAPAPRRARIQEAPARTAPAKKAAARRAPAQQSPAHEASARKARAQRAVPARAVPADAHGAKAPAVPPTAAKAPRRPAVQGKVPVVPAARRTRASTAGPRPDGAARGGSGAVPAPVRPSGPPRLRVVRPLDDHDHHDERHHDRSPRRDAVPTPPAAPAAAGSPAAGLPVETAPVRRAAGQRASVPDWADVLFGTAPARRRHDGGRPDRST